MVGVPRWQAIIAIVLCLTATAGCRGAGDGEATAADGPTANTTLWPHAELSEDCVVKVARGFRYMSTHESSGRLRVWQLGADYALTGPLLDSDDGGWIAQDFEWVGDELVYVATRKLPPEIAAVERDSDVVWLWPADFVAANSRLVKWMPDSHTETVLGTTGYAVLLAHPTESSVLAIGPFIDARHGSFDGARAHVLDAGTGAVSAVLQLLGVNRIAGTGIRPHVPNCVCRDPEAGGLFIVDNPEAEEGGETGQPAHVLRYLKLDGSFVTLSSQRRHRLIHRPNLGCIPVPSAVLGGRMVASLAEDGVQGRRGMAVYDKEGLQKWYPFSARWRCPVGLKQHGTSWAFICPGPDGHSAVFQSYGRAPDTNDAQSLYEVWLWNIETDTGAPLCPVGRIAECFGWLSDTAIAVGIEVKDEKGKYLRMDYGVIHWEPDEG